MPSSNSYQARLKVQGWGADLDPRNRPAVPREKRPPHGTGAHWSQPEKQKTHLKILKSPEFKEMPAVFGTTCPLKGVSGFIRKYAYTLSEGRKSHWLLLLLADRVDVVESALSSLIEFKAHNPISEMGLRSELRHGAFRSRFRQNRYDIKRQRNELLMLTSILTGAWLLLKRKH